MALVVLLRGVNVGGHRTFRPSALIKQLTHLDAVNIGAAGTFVIRQPVSRTELRAELGRRLSFDTEIMICHGREIVGLMSQNHFADQPLPPETPCRSGAGARNASPGFRIRKPVHPPGVLRAHQRDHSCRIRM